VGPRRRLSVSFGLHATVFQAEIFANLACIDRNYTRGQTYICSDSQAALRALAAPGITSKLLLECREAICVLSSRNRVSLRWVPGHSKIQDSEDADTLVRDGSSSSFLGPKTAIPVSPCVGRLKFKEWLREEYS
jgi:ribonuclease HI